MFQNTFRALYACQNISNAFSVYSWVVGMELAVMSGFDWCFRDSNMRRLASLELSECGGFPATKQGNCFLQTPLDC